MTTKAGGNGRPPRGAFAELKPPLGADEALAEATRCLYCYHAPCQRACPTAIDVPGFIKKIASGNREGSAQTILEANVLGFSCARVCPTEVLCEGACVLNELHGGRPIAIGRLQRHATDPVVLDPQRPAGSMLRPGPDSGRRVAIVGAGPAGLACAAELRRRGHRVTVYEAAQHPGGLNTVGVADYKLDQQSSLAEIAWLVRELQIEIRYGERVGEQLSVAQLLAEHDALFVGVGLGGVPALGIPGEELPGCDDVLDFIAELKRRPKEQLSLAGQRVAVIGGGNTAIDGVTQAARLGAERVYLVYRRDLSRMKAYAHELALARQDGVQLVLCAQPLAILGEQRVSGLRCQRMAVADDGRLTPIADGIFELAVDRVLRAIGQASHAGPLAGADGVTLDRGGRVITDEQGRTANARIWAGGDCANGGKEVVNAVAEGQRAAQSIDAALREGAAG